VRPTNVSTNVLVNREKPPFDNPDIRRALALAIDRKSFVDILLEGQGDIGGAMLPPPAGVWGMPPEVLQTVIGYGADGEKNRADARTIMGKLGYGPEKRLNIKVSTRNIATYRDPAVILIDQLKEIYIDGELDTIETANWFSIVARKDYQIGLQQKRKALVWDIDRKLQEDVARPIIYHNRRGDVLAAAAEGAHPDGQQHLQRQPVRGYLARQVAVGGHADAIDGAEQGMLSSERDSCGPSPPQVREENSGILFGAAFRPDAPDLVRDIGDHLSDAAPRAGQHRRHPV
jgi:hypothetical protein